MRRNSTILGGRLATNPNLGLPFEKLLPRNTPFVKVTVPNYAKADLKADTKQEIRRKLRGVAVKEWKNELEKDQCRKWKALRCFQNECGVSLGMPKPRGTSVPKLTFRLGTPQVSTQTPEEPSAEVGARNDNKRCLPPPAHYPPKVSKRKQSHSRVEGSRRDSYDVNLQQYLRMDPFRKRKATQRKGPSAKKRKLAKNQANILKNMIHEKKATFVADIISIWGLIWNLNMNVENSIYLACRDRNAPLNYAYLTHHLVDLDSRVTNGTVSKTARPRDQLRKFYCKYFEDKKGVRLRSPMARCRAPTTIKYTYSSDEDDQINSVKDDATLADRDL